MEISEKKYCGKIQNKQHNKVLNPKFSALVDLINDAEAISKYLPKNPNDSITTKDSTDPTTSKEPNYFFDDNGSGIEPIEITGKDDEDEDGKKKILKIIVNKYSQLISETERGVRQLIRETERGVRQNCGLILILLDILKDCEVIVGNDYEESYGIIEKICNMYRKSSIYQHQQNLDDDADGEDEETLHENIAVRRGLISADNTLNRYLLVNNNSSNSEAAVPSRLQSSDSSMSDVDDFDTQLSNQSKERMNHCSLIKIQKDMNNGHSLSKIALTKKKKWLYSLSKIVPTEKKKWPQKPCVLCRKKYGVRKDTRYICNLCNTALCKEPCFSEYHCNK